MNASGSDPFRRFRRIAALALVLSLVAAVAAACLPGATPTATPTPTAGATPTAAATPEATATPDAAATTAAEATPTSAPTAEPTPTPVVEERMGYLLQTLESGGTQSIRIDYVEMYTGAEAVAKAKEDGSPVVEVDDGGHEYIPNDYYIRNNNPLVRTLPLAVGCVILLVDMSGGPVASVETDFAGLTAALADHPRILLVIGLADGVVTEIEEFYVP